MLIPEIQNLLKISLDFFSEMLKIRGRKLYL